MIVETSMEYNSFTMVEQFLNSNKTMLVVMEMDAEC